MKNTSQSKKRFNIILCILSIITLLCLSTTIFVFVNPPKHNSSEVTNTIKNYTSEEVNLLIDSAKKDTSEEMLTDIKSKLTNGASTLSTIRSLYPKNIIYYDIDKYIFASIMDSVPKHNLKAENFLVDEKKEITYSENGAVLSHKGIDVSKYQGDIDWTKVRNSNVEYAILRIGYRSYGTGIITDDANFKQNIKGASKAGLGVGVYFFSQATTTSEAIEEAQYVIDLIKSYNVKYPIVLDMEEITNDTFRQQGLTPNELTDICIAFCDKIKSAGYTPMIYANLKFFISKLNLDQLTAYEKWYAGYDTSLYFPYDISMWQYSDSGTVDGIPGKVDLNISFKEWK